MRAVPGSFDPVVVAAIDARLDGVERDGGVRVAFAVESGSRAWGFPSPDSDYDCRFVFVRPVEQLLSPWPRRDVIETPLDAVLDVNGWELGKALKLLLKGNAVIIEWLRSPVVYRGDEAFRAALLAFAEQYASRELVGRHYLHLGERQRRTYFADEKAVQLKKLFYALRPAATLRWLRMRPAQAIAPMHFPTLMAEVDPSPDLVAVVSNLLTAKANTRELGVAALPVAIRDFIDGDFALAHAAFEGGYVRPTSEAVAAAEALFRDLVRWFDPGNG